MVIREGLSRYFNAKHQRTGTIWEGRFKSCLVDSEHYLFALYTEMNPVKASGRRACGLSVVKLSAQCLGES